MAGKREGCWLWRRSTMGGKRAEVAKIGGVTLQVVRDWALRFNAHGPDGLIDRKAPGQPPLLKDEHRVALAAIVESGPILAVHGVVRWRIVDLCQWIFEEFRRHRQLKRTRDGEKAILLRGEVSRGARHWRLSAKLQGLARANLGGNEQRPIQDMEYGKGLRFHREPREIVAPAGRI